MTDVQDMIEAAWDAQAARTRIDAGAVLAQGGWSVFPLPDGQKFDTGGQIAQSYMTATIDPGVFVERAEWNLDRWNCSDVNLGLSPAKCIVPLLAIDLDGAEAINGFFQSGIAAGETAERMGSWLRCKTTRPEGGRHVYFISPYGQGYHNAQHAWGGEVRSAAGHVVAPPSVTPDGRYELLGTTLIEAPTWVLLGSHANAITGPQHQRTHVNRSQLNDIVQRLSDERWPGDKYGEVALNRHLEEIKASGTRVGDVRHGRNPTMTKAVYRILDLALDGRLLAQPALDAIADAYVGLFAFDGPGEQDKRAQEIVRAVNSWCEKATDLKEKLQSRDDAHKWAETHVKLNSIEERVRRLEEWRQNLRDKAPER